MIGIHRCVYILLSVGMHFGVRDFNGWVNYMSVNYIPGKGFVPYVRVYPCLHTCVQFRAEPERREDHAVIPATPLALLLRMGELEERSGRS